MKDLLTSLRASNETYNSMKHSARAIIRRAEIPLLAVIVLYKAATNLLFVPLMQQLWSLTLRFAPMHYLSNNNASDVFSSPAIILCITLIAILTAFWALYEFSVLLHGLDLARKGETIRLPALLRTSLADIRHAFLPQNWLVLVYSAVLIPFTNFFLACNYITQLAVPEYIIGVIRANSRYYLLYLAAGAALLFLCVSWVLVLPLFVLERKSLWQSVKESFCCIRRRVFRAFLLLLRWNLSVVLRSLLLTAAVAVPLYGIIIAVGLQSTQAMFALSRAALATAAFCEGNYALLGVATKDVLHQKYRLPLIEGGDDVFELAQDLGAQAVYISGAGPTIMAVVHKDDTEFFYPRRGSAGCGQPACAILPLHRLLADNVGAVVS